MKHLLFLVFSLFTFSCVYSQGMHYSGVVNDTMNNQPLANAVVMVVNLEDSVLFGFTRTNQKGEFELKDIPFSEQELLISHPNYGDKSYYVIGSPENNRIEIPNIILPEKATELDEVVVFANKEPIYFKGDTLVYVADSFKTKENAVVEDLLKKLPGIDVDEDGNITSQGQSVTKVLVDGDEFFGEDPTVATKNLGAKGVETVEVYETTEDNGDGEETVQVMDVKLKEEYKKGYFGKIAGATDFQDFYEGEVLLNSFNKDLKLSVFGLGSNTPNTGFGVGDAYKYGLTNELNANFEDGISFSNNTSRRGLPRTFKGGFYYSDKIGKKAKLGFNYTYNNNDIQQLKESKSQFIFADTTYTTRENNNFFENQESHAINLSLDLKLDSLTKLIVEPSVNIKRNSIEQTDSTSFLSALNSRTSSTLLNNTLDNEGLDINATVRLERQFMKRKREFTAEYQYGYTDNEADERLYSDIRYLNGNPGADSLTNQSKVTLSNTQGHRGRLSYNEPLTRKWNLELDYKLDYFFGDQSKSTNNFDGQAFTIFDSTFSNNFENTRLENRASVGLKYETRKMTFKFGTAARNVQIDNRNLFTETSILQDVNNLLPYTRFIYKFSNAERLRFTYRTSSQQPTITQLQPILDNSNPNSVAIGNPDLLPTYAHSINIGYNKWEALKRQWVWINGYFTATNDAFSSEVIYAPDGRTISRAINVDGNFFTGLNAGAGLNAFDKFLRVQPNIGVSYNKFNSRINTLDNTTTNTGFDGGLELSIDRDSVFFSIGANYSYNIPESSLSFGSNQPYSIQTYRMNFSIDLPWKMEFETDADYFINSNLSAGFNQTPLLINASLSKRFLKTENLTLSFEANDILNQNIDVNRTINNNVIMDRTTQVIARYFLVRLQLRFNNNKTKVEDERWY